MRLAGVALVGLVVFFSATFVVPQTAQALVFQFGRVARPPITQPGLYFKWPIIENVIEIDKRILDLELPTQEVIASDQKRLVVDAFTRYRVTDPLRFYQSVNNVAGANMRLTSIVNSAVRTVLAEANFAAVVRTDRSGLMQRIRDDVNRQANGLGIEVVDVRLRRADLPEQNSQAVFQRMQTERQREAADIRAQGSQLSQTIKAESRPRSHGAPRRCVAPGGRASRHRRSRAQPHPRGGLRTGSRVLRVLPLDAGLRGLDAVWRYAHASCQPGFIVLPVLQRSAPVQGPAADRTGRDRAGTGRAGSRRHRQHRRCRCAWRGCPALSLFSCEGRGRSPRQRAIPDRGLSCLDGPRHDEARLRRWTAARGRLSRSPGGETGHRYRDCVERAARCIVHLMSRGVFRRVSALIHR